MVVMSIRTFIRIMLPMAIRVLLWLMVFSFLFAWGDLIFGTTFISEEPNETTDDRHI